MLKLHIISHINFSTLLLGRLGINKFQGWALVVLLEFIHGTSTGMFTLNYVYYNSVTERKCIEYQNPPIFLILIPVRDSWSM